MQRYRINFNWLIGVFVSSLVLAVVAYFLHGWQVKRKADYFLKNAEQALVDENPLEAYLAFGKYFQLRPTEQDVRIKMAHAAVDVIKDTENPLLTREQRGRALHTLERAVSNTDDAELRRELAEIVIGSRPLDAITYLKDLLADDPNDSELNSMLVRAYVMTKDDDQAKQLAFQLIGYDKKTDKFDLEKSTLVDDTDVYALLTGIVFRKDDNPELARRIIDQMVEANPELPLAYLRKSLLLSSFKDPREEIAAQDRLASEAALNKAYELDPKDAEILARKGAMAMDRSQYPAAKADYEKAITQFEKTLTELADKDLETLDDVGYLKAKAKLFESISGYEISKPSHQEAIANYDEAKAGYESVCDQFSRAVLATVSSQADAEAMSSFEDAQSEYKKAASLYEASKPDYEAAKEFFAIGLKEHGDHPQFFRLMANAETKLGQRQAAIDVLDSGINKFEINESFILILSKIDILFGEQDYPGIEAEIERLSDLNMPALMPIVDYEKSRVLLGKKQWREAAQGFKRVRPLLIDRPSLQAKAGTMLGRAYENLGSQDLAMQAYRTVLNDQPDYAAAKISYEKLQRRIKPDEKPAGFNLDRIVDDHLRLPEEEQDWDEMNRIIEKAVAQKNMTEAQRLILRSKVLMKRGNHEAAKELVKQAYQADKEDIEVQYTAILLYATDPERGFEESMKLLDKLEKKFGLSVRSLAQRATLLARFKPDDVTAKLHQLLVEMKTLEEADQLKVRKFVATRFEALGDFASASELYEKAIEAEPNSLPVRMHLFELAVRQLDEVAMSKAQERVLEFVKSKNDANYILTDVRRRIILAAQQGLDRTELLECRKLLDDALKQRPEWYELHITYGHVLLMLNEELDLALEHFDEALKYGPPKSTAVGVQVRLLAERGLYAQARERMMRLDERLRPRVLGKLEAEVLLKSGDAKSGYEAAKSLAELQPNDAKIQMWLAAFAQQMEDGEVAIDAIRKALKASPANPDYWLSLIGTYGLQKKQLEYEEAFRDAHLSVDAEFLPALAGKRYEYSGGWEIAEKIYLADYADRFEELPIARRMGDFYLRWSSKNPANIGKASVYINRILRAANEGEVEFSNPNVAWARQKAAGILLTKGDYQSSLKAERLLRQGALTSKESELLVDILIQRKNPKSLMQAKQLLLGLQNEDRLHKKGALQLARILSMSKQWDASKQVMVNEIASNPKDPKVRIAYIDLLIDQGNYRAAEQGINNLAGLEVNKYALVQLRARLASERGDQAQVVQVLKSLLPKMGGALNEEQLQNVLSVAQLAARFGAYDFAGQLHKTYAGRSGDNFELARFLVFHGDADQAMLLLKSLYEDRTDKIVQLAGRLLAARRGEFGDKYDEPVDRLIDRALRDDPDSIVRQLARAEAYELQEKHDESIAAYEVLLARDDLPVRVRATVKNNLGFQLGLLGQRVDEAAQLIEEAVETFGPDENMLDTRAVVRIAQGKYDLAIEDMKLALSVSRDPIKYYHLAKAHVLAGEGKEAMKAWKKAQELGFEQKGLSRLERAGFPEIQQKIEDL